ncbi:MAG: SRPBCC family protein [Acidobacteriota bacterium]
MADICTIIDAQTIRFERLLPASIERAWDYLTKPERLRGWLAESEMDLRAGGHVELCFDVGEVPDRAKAGAVIRGVVTRIEPPRALAYTWTDTRAVPDSEVTFELDAPAQDVLLVLTHRRLPPPVLPNCAAGWHTHLGILLKRLRGEEPEPFLPVYERLLPMYTYLATSAEADAAR